MWTLDWERGQAPLGMASGWPPAWNLALLYVNILGALTLCQTLYSSEAGASACLGLRVHVPVPWSLTVLESPRPLLRAPTGRPGRRALQELCRGKQGLW